MKSFCQLCEGDTLLLQLAAAAKQYVFLISERGLALPTVALYFREATGVVEVAAVGA